MEGPPIKVSGAVFSSDRQYRYVLRRVWGDGPSRVCFVCLNPSIADEVIDDPTQRRLRKFAQDWGYDGYIMGNIFAYISTDPRSLKVIAEVGNPIGNPPALNDEYLRSMAKVGDLVVAAWGTWGKFWDRGEHVLKMLQEIKPVYHLGLNQDGSPKHPLYLKANSMPRLFIGKPTV